MALEAKNWPDIEVMEIGEVRIEPVSELGILSVATPKGGRAALEKVLKKNFAITIPAIGQSETSKKASALGLQSDQFFLTFPYVDAWQAEGNAAKIGAAGYTTDQSDAWVMFRLGGADVKIALERICKLDLDDTVFGVGAVARTSMEHLGAIIYRESSEHYLLFAASSSRHDFAHAIQKSAENIKS